MFVIYRKPQSAFFIALLLLAHLFFQLNDKRTHDAGFADVGKDAQKFFIDSNRVFVFLHFFINKTEKLVNDYCVRRAGKLRNRDSSL